VAKAQTPDFTPKELTLIANMVVGRHDSLVEIRANSRFHTNDKGLTKAINAIAPVAEKLRPWYTGEDS
jgi:hypothetical protein